MTTLRKFTIATTIAATTSMSAIAQQATPPYGTPISLEQAKKVIAAGEAEARKNNLFVVITVVDTGGYVVVTHRLDNTQIGSIAVAESKARSAVLFRRSSKAFEDAIAGGGIGLRVLGLQGAVPYEGGVPIIVDGKIIGAVGVSGMLPRQDGQVANAAAGAVEINPSSDGAAQRFH
jgi:uncharacterized protein GlcG (DUF336 family)